MTQMLLFTLFLKTERKLNCSWGSDPWGSHSDLSWGFREIKQRKWQFLDWLDHAIIHALVRSPRLRPRWSHPPSSHLTLELELPSLASKPSCFFWFERHVIIFRLRVYWSSSWSSYFPNPVTSDSFSDTFSSIFLFSQKFISLINSLWSLCGL